jgi:hypothetical protein
MVSKDEKELEATYGPAAPFSEHKRGDHIVYTNAEGLPGAGVIVWCQAPTGEIGLRYVVAPDVPTGFVDFVVPGDVITSTQEARPKETL